MAANFFGSFDVKTCHRSTVWVMKMFCRMNKGTSFTNRALLSLCTGPMLSVCTFCAAAQETNAPVRLPDILVTATRTPTAPFDIPFSVSVVNATKLRQN